MNGVSTLSKRFPPSFRISQARGEGMISHGTRQWTDYEVKSDIVLHLGNYGGVALRVQGLRRYYGVRVTRDNSLQIVRVRDDQTKVLAETSLRTSFEKKLSFAARAQVISATVDGISLSADDDDAEAFTNGGIGLIIHEGALSTDAVTVSA